MPLHGLLMSTTCDVERSNSSSGWLARSLAALPLFAIVLFAPAPVKAVSGFTGTFEQSTWTVVNTDPAQTLSGVNGICNTYSGYSGNDNNVGCTSPTYFDDVTIAGTEVGTTPSITLGVYNTTTVELTNNNTNGKPYRISFDWAFDWKSDDQYVAFTLSSGTVVVDGVDYGSTWTSSATDYPSSTASIYLPPGAKLTFSVTTDNYGDYPTLAISSFDAVEIPAPLPLAGGTSAFLWSRRLRRRRLPAGSPPQPASLPTLPLAGQLRRPAGRLAVPSPRQQELQRYAELLGRPLPAPIAHPPGPEPRRACNAPVSKSNSR
jgi:hypothetical protein